MNNPRTMPLLTTVIFIAVILSCTTYFGITALLGSPDSFAESPYRSDAPLPAALTPFDRGFYLDATMQDWMTAADYRLFNKVADRSVIVGQNDFLFPLTARTDGRQYDYLEDYAGSAAYTDDELDRIAKSLTKRSIAYANQGTTYMLAVIPNVQTVYREKLPWGLDASGGETRLEQLEAYLDRSSNTVFLNLTDCLLAAREKGMVCNNTEDSLNALGAYAVYCAVMDALPADVSSRVGLMENVSIFTRYTAGKALARAAGVETLIKNRTLSLSNDTVLKYQTLERIAGMEITYVKTAYKDEIPNRPAILLEFSDEWDKIQLMPYFSNTFGVAAYKTNPAYSQLGVDYLSPAVAVQFIHESQLDQLLDETITLSYNDGLEPGDDPFNAMTPIVLGTAQSAPDSICIVGRCEEGSVITLSGEGVVPAVVQTQGERFILEAVLEAGASSAAVTLTARVPDKQESQPETLQLALDPADSATRAEVGSNSMLFSPDSTNSAYAGVYTRQQLRRVSGRFAEEARTIERLTGKPTQVISAYIPDKLDVYGEMLDDSAPEYAHIPRIAQLSDALSAYSRIHVFDFTLPLRTARSAGLQYRQTGSGLTPLGAFSAYRALMTVLAEEDPRLAPLHRSDYQPSQVTMQGGDLIAALGLDGASITEQVTVLTPIHSGVTIHGEVDDAHSYTHRDDSLPTALIMRDAYGTALLPYLSEHFSYTYVLPEGELNPDDAIFRELRPDYVFRLTSEYHLPLN